jgi:hypothetical protein
MTSTRGNWLRSLLWGVAISSVLVAAHGARAQGFSPDPFRPFNAQYDAYVYPIGPAGPGGDSRNPGYRDGVRSANQFENYLQELQGADRSRVERYGIGMPYYRSAVDPRFLKNDRDYVPNSKSSRSFEKTQQRITEKYLAFFEEHDPKKRAKLFRDYTRAQSNVSRLLATGRRTNASRVLAAAEEAVAPRGAADEPEAMPARTRAPRREAPATDDGTAPVSPRRSSARGATVAPDMAIPPAPPPPGASAAGRSRRTASDVLSRARALRDADAKDLGPPPVQPRPIRRSRTPANPATPTNPTDR